ncbi:hypothetical protein GLAREA_04712 [Glarea lozoyensis ATCC 20868]|uniref:2EXR domain-containing protein n=1 Tax=Glarea lozoyensis (strain ATCC 20868 / MF5171) TaxID=1116229 RepID=S3D7D6_GLAL2|nr:uncharacterized protein GLAREA_04712 [Glarea lozoyensis ATCC 20868]EPE27921.1 hypothetical protein GLAREA_04712 [Glarea lozoyensis ATCC 20868]
MPSSATDRLDIETAKPLEQFLKFNQLPLELRIRIWQFALEPRLIHLHHRTISVDYQQDENAYNGYAPEGPEESIHTPEEISNLPVYRPLTKEEDDEEHDHGTIQDTTERPPIHMVITPCNGAAPRCDCKFYPVPYSRSAPSLPAVLFACHESRQANIARYERIMEDEYDNRGIPFIPATSGLVKSSSSEPPVTGITINPAIDTIALSVNIASKNNVHELKRFTLIAARQVPDITTVVLKGHIAMPPYKFWSSQRFQYWRRWGDESWWVPTISLLKFRYLKEVIFYYHAEKKNRAFLPDEWKARTRDQWISELRKVEDRWPESWKGEPPMLKFVTDLKMI